MKRLSILFLTLFMTVFFMTSCATNTAVQKAQTANILTAGYQSLALVNNVTGMLLQEKKITKNDAIKILNVTVILRKQLDQASNDLAQGNVALAQQLSQQASTMALSMLNVLTPSGQIDLSKLPNLSQSNSTIVFPAATNATKTTNSTITNSTK